MNLIWKITKVDYLYNPTHPCVYLATITINSRLIKCYSIWFSIVQHIRLLVHIVKTYYMRSISMIVKWRLVHFNWLWQDWPFNAVHFVYSDVTWLKMIIHYMYNVIFLLIIKALLSLVLYIFLSTLKTIFEMHYLMEIWIWL